MTIETVAGPSALVAAVATVVGAVAVGRITLGSGA
jgi:hypothetical protein